MTSQRRLDIVSLSLALLLALATLLSCSSPESVEIYVPVSKADGAGRLAFVADMSDTMSTYDFSIYARIDCSGRRFENIRSFPLKIDMVSPSGKEYTETVYVPVSSFEDRNMSVHDFCETYRSASRPSEYGEWDIYITPPSIDGLRGMGLIMKINR
ncbi:MAG: hypothetical protein ACI4TU_04600 [Candidatus Cryptobacteroides sp.]